MTLILSCSNTQSLSLRFGELCSNLGTTSWKYVKLVMRHPNPDFPVDGSCFGVRWRFLGGYFGCLKEQS